MFIGFVFASSTIWNSSLIHLEQIAKVSCYKAFRVRNIPELEKILKKNLLSEIDRSTLYYAIAKSYDDQKNYEKSCHFFIRNW